MSIRMDFCDVFDDVTKEGRKLQTSEYLENGLHPIYDQGQNEVAGYTNETEGLFTNTPVILFGDHTRVVKYVDTPCFLGADGVKLLKPKIQNVNAKYLFYAVCSVQIPNTGYNRHFKWLKEATISIPAKEEQDKIVAILDETNHLIFLRKKQLQKLDDLVKARFVEMFGDPEYNDKGWPIRKLNDLCSVGSSKRIYQEEQTMDGVPFWRISDLVAKMDTGNVESSLFIPESRYEALKAEGLVPEPGDILVTSRGTLGRCYIIAPDDLFYFQDGMISWLSQYEDTITPLYIQFLFSMSGFRKQIDSMQAGSTVAYLSIAMLKKLDIMLPDRVTQEQFAAFVSQVEKSKLSIQQGLEKLETLKKSLIQQYFG